MQELIFGIIGGTALLMYGVNKMGAGIEKASGDTMKKILTVLTGKVWSAFLVGIFVTAIVQSSTAVTVLTVGFVNSGIMKLSQAIGIIYGANIGTTVTAQLMAFSFKFKLTDIALPVIGIGFAMNNMWKNKKIQNFGEALMGFGMMFLGLKILNEGIPFMQENETLKYYFTTYASIPIIGILIGVFATAMVHSSTATIGLVMILSQAGLLDLQAAICIMLGDNLGTCFTAQIASMTGNINARRTAWAHTFYNLFGVIIAFIMLPYFSKTVVVITDYLQPNGDISSYIANSHTLFNTINAFIFLPITKYYVAFLYRVIKPKKNQEDQEILLDKLLIDTPVAALRASKLELIRASQTIKTMIMDVLDMIYINDLSKIGKVVDNERQINKKQKDLIKYIIELTKEELTESQSIIVPAIIISINRLERSGDRIMEIISLLEKKIDGNLLFTEEAIGELRELEEIIIDLFDKTILILEKKDEKIIGEVVELKNRVDKLSDEFQINHIKRLHDEKSNVDSGVIFIDMVVHLKRIADHAYEIVMLSEDELNGEKRKQVRG